MKIAVNTKPDIQEIEVIINCAAENQMVQRIIGTLNSIDKKLMCRRDGEMFHLDVRNILYIESVDRRTFIYTNKHIYETDKRLYELEDYLNGLSFFRASKAIIINLQRVHSLRPELGARLLLTMDNDERIIVSRQYAGKIKEALEVV